MQVSYAIIFVSDMPRSVAFYRDVLGIPLKLETSHWSEFETEGATLALHISDVVEGNEPSHSEPAGICRPGLRVSNLDEFHRRMMENKVQCVHQPKETFGARVAQYVDPDGLTFSVAQAPPTTTDR